MQKAELEREKQNELERDVSLLQFKHDIQQIKSSQRLAFQETEIRESIHSAKNKAEETFFRQQLEFIQTAFKLKWSLLPGIGESPTQQSVNGSGALWI